MPRIVLLDIDGTLIDTNQLHADSWHEALAQYRIASDVDALKTMIGMGADKLLPKATGIEKDSELGARIADTRGKLFMRDYLPRAQPFANARAFVQRLLDRGFTPVVASSANQQELEGLLERAQLQDLLSLRTGADDASESKPYPDIVQAALDKVKARPQDAIMIGDTPYDLEAAQRAKVPLIAVRSGGWTDVNLRGAVAIYDDIAELLARFDQSPLTESQPPRHAAT